MPAATAEHTQQSLSEMSLADLKQLCTELTIDGHRGKKQTYIDALLSHQQQQRQLEANNGQLQLFDLSQFATATTATTANHYDLEDSTGRRRAASRKRHADSKKVDAPQPQAPPPRCEAPRPADHPDGEEVEILRGDFKVPAGIYKVKILQQDDEAAILQFGSVIPLEGLDDRLYFTHEFRKIDTDAFVPSPLFPIPPAEPEEDGDRDEEEETQRQQQRGELNPAKSQRFQVGDRLLTKEGMGGKILRKESSYWIVLWDNGREWYYTSEDFSQLGYRRAPLRLNPDRVPPIFGKSHCADEIGQLSLLEWEGEEEEAPDPDDFSSVGEWEKAWKEWSLTHELPVGFSSPMPDGADRAASFPAAKYRGAITRAEAAEALGISSDRIVKDPTELWNAVVVVYLDDAGKRRSRFVSYRKFRRWWQSFIDSLFSEAIAQTVRHELQRYGDYCPPDLRGNLESLLQPKEKEPEIEREAIAA